MIEDVEEMDHASFYAAYRADGHGRPAYEPSMMVALLLYALAAVEQLRRRAGDLTAEQRIDELAFLQRRYPYFRELAELRRELAAHDPIGGI